MYACSQKLHIIMELATGGDLAGHIEKRAKTGEHYSEEVTHVASSAQTARIDLFLQAIRHFGAGLLQAVAFLHRNHVLQ